MPTITASIDIDLTRLRSEFDAFPGMCLTVAQVGRLLDVPCDDAAQLLGTLEDEQLLVKRANGNYGRKSPLFA